MIVTTEVAQLEDYAYKLVAELLQSEAARAYVEQTVRMQKDQQTALKMQSFLAAKANFEKVEAYGKYAPDYTTFRRAARAAKRQLDLDEAIADFRVAETNLQNLLDMVCYRIAQSVSEEIKIDAGNPFFEFAKKGCGGCHVG